MTEREYKTAITIREANPSDLNQIRTFTDFWLSGRGMKKKAPGAVNDVFISPGQHAKYIRSYNVFLMFYSNQLIGWAVKQYHHQLIHLLISGYHRNQGFGTFFLKIIKPELIRSKTDQSSGNPKRFYESLGYESIGRTTSKPKLLKSGAIRKSNKVIELFIRRIL